MRAHDPVGRVYRRCGCRDARRRQLGTHCPSLVSDPDHGTWTFAVDLPAGAPGTHPRTVRRGGFATPDAAQLALRRFVAGIRVGVDADPNQTVAEYLTGWLAMKRGQLKPTTYVRYRDYVLKDLIPALGYLPLEDLAFAHIHQLIRTQLDAGRGRQAVWHLQATLSSALGDAFRLHRIPANPACPPVIPRPVAPERQIWTITQVVRFLWVCRVMDPAFADLVELLIGTGLRKGEALGLRWSDIDLDSATLLVRRTLSAIDNHQLVVGEPKTRAFYAPVALSSRVQTALRHRAAERPDAGAGEWAANDECVFSHADGTPWHPQWVLNHFHAITRVAGVPRCGIHDLRHLAATIALTNHVDVAVVSKTLRHTSIATTSDIYGHLTRPAAREAVGAIAAALDRAEHTTHAEPPLLQAAARHRAVGTGQYGKPVRARPRA